MAVFQPFKKFAGAASWNWFFPCLLLVQLAACSSGTEEALAEGALAEQQLASGDVAAARRAITRAMAARDDLVDLHLLRARIELAAGSQSGAFDALSDALSLEPTSGPALHGVSQLGLTTGHLRESLEATETILTLDPTNNDALVARGVHALVRRQYADAKAFAERVLASTPDHENASILKARASFMEGDSEAALTAINSIEEESESAAAVLTKLEIYRELQRPLEMSEQFLRLRKLQSEDLMLRLDEANFRFKQGDRPVAHSLVVRTLAQPEVSRDIAEMGVRLWGEYGVADLPATAGTRIAESGTLAARVTAARFFIEAGEMGRAQHMISALPGVDGQALHARALAQREGYRAALSVADKVLARDETHCDALIAHSRAAVALGDGTAALRSAQRAAAECPDQTAAWIAAAKAYAKLERSSGVNRIYSQAYQVHPQSLRIAESFAEWLLEEERPREAEAVARRLTRAAPALLGGWKLYEQICRRVDSDCRDEAMRGLSEAGTRYWIDVPPGTLPTTGLTGRLTRR